MTDEDSEDENSLYSFFVCEEYVEKKWLFDDLEQALFCSTMSTTAHDLTGQIVWPASVILAWFITRNQAIFSNSKVIELGAGCGLAGFLLSQFATFVTITDGNNVVLRLLKKNQDHLCIKNVNVCKLLWGTTSSLRCTFENLVFPQYIVGADIILWPNQIMPLLFTIRWLLLAFLFSQHHVPDENRIRGKAFVSYIVRATTTTDLFYETATTLGLSVAIIPREQFLQDQYDKFSHLDSRLFEISLTNSEEKTDFKWFDEPETQLENAYLPC